MAERWVPTLGYSVANVDGVYCVMRHGRKYVTDRVKDEDVSLSIMAKATDYNEAVEIVRALRAELAREVATT